MCGLRATIGDTVSMRKIVWMGTGQEGWSCPVDGPSREVAASPSALVRMQGADIFERGGYSGKVRDLLVRVYSRTWKGYSGLEFRVSRGETCGRDGSASVGGYWVVGLGLAVSRTCCCGTYLGTWECE